MNKPENLILVIFGASGDLTKRKLIPALLDLKVKKLLPDRFAILGVSRSKMSDDTFRDKILESLPDFSPEHADKTNVLMNSSKPCTTFQLIQARGMIINL